MRKGFWLFQCVAWTAVVMMAALVLWQERIMSAEPRVLQVYHAIGGVKVRLDQSARAQYVGQLKSFARDLGFTIRFHQTSPGPNDIVAHLERHDVWMVGGLASDLFGGPDVTYDFAFYGPRNQPVPDSILDPVVVTLRRSLSGIDGAVITDIPR
jgi:hypothetical protein